MATIDFLTLVSRIDPNRRAKRRPKSRNSTLLYAERRSGDPSTDSPSQYFAITTAPDSGYPLRMDVVAGKLRIQPLPEGHHDPDPPDPIEFEGPLWLAKLCKLCDEAMTPHIADFARIPFLEETDPSHPNWSKVACESILSDHLRTFQFERSAFFPSHAEWFEWECWSHAGSWLKHKIAPEEACESLEVDVATYQDLMGKTLSTCIETAKNAALESGDEWIDSAIPIRPQLTQQEAIVAPVMEPYVKPPFLGGAPTLEFPRDPKCKHAAEFRMRRPSDKAPKEVWWWQNLYGSDQWPDALRDLFFQNWAQSAFFYEYRCRLNRLSETPWFGVPWITLNHIQRAFLREIWPPKFAGPKTIIRPIHPAISEYGRLSRLTIHLDVDLSTMSNGAICNQVETTLKRERLSRGIPDFTQGEGKVQTNYSWDLLEAMDSTYYEGASNRKRQARAQQQERYTKACERAGIRP